MKNNKEMCHCHSVTSMSLTLILIGVVYVLQHKGIMFTNIILWPWILIAIGICGLIFKECK